MFRFISLIWNPSSAAQAEAASALLSRFQCQSAADWESVFSVSGMQVLCTGVRSGSSEAHVLPKQSGVVLGTIFETVPFSKEDSMPSPRKASISTAECESILASKGRSMITRCWGRYVAFIYDAHRRAQIVLRDPLGGLPCFKISVNGVDVFFSLFEDGHAINRASFYVNYEYVTAYLFTEGWLESGETGLQGVASVQSGECVERSGDNVVRTFYWDPQQIAADSPIEDPCEATRKIRSVTHHCVSAWASCYSRILHRLSGGLDSSIVLACLRKRHVTCLNHYSSGSNTDERLFARLMAARTGAELVEHERELNVELDAIRKLPKSASPTRCIYPLHYGKYESALAASRSATAIFSGEMGDALFYQSPPLPAAADYVSRHRLGGSLFAVLLDIARIEGLSVWAVLESALREGWMRPSHWDPRQDALKYRQLLTPEAVEHALSNDRFLHPWVKLGRDTPPGKLRHIYYSLLVPIEPFYDPTGMPSDPEHVAPLLSQPLVELCLRIPTYVLLTGGWDRAIARRAFFDELPREISTRRTKGGVEEYMDAVLTRHREFIQDLLIDGVLTRNRILDRSKVEAVLSGKPTGLRSPNSELYAYVTAEAWLRNWDGIQQRAAA